VLLDDVGSGASGAFGGPCPTPTADQLAAGGSTSSPRIHWVQLDVGKDDNDQCIDPEERLRIAIAGQ